MKYIYLSVFLIVFVSCKSTYKIQDFAAKNIPGEPDYNLEENWAVLPHKYSEDLKVYSSKEIDTLQADVFFCIQL